VLATKLVTPLVGPKPVSRPAARFQIVETDTLKILNDSANLAISPDGAMLAFAGSDTLGTTRLWVRPLDATAPRPLAGTENAQLPFFSPDGRSIGFFTESKLKRIAIATGDIDAIADVKRARGGSWNKKDQILFSPTSDGPIFVVGASGGVVRQVTTLDTTRGESGHRFPEFLPDGNHFLYTSLPPRAGIYTIRAGALSGGKTDSVAALTSGVRYVAPGWLVFKKVLALFAVRFDAGSRRIKGEAVPLRENSPQTNYAGSAGVDAGNGVLAFEQFSTTNSRLAWFDATGRELGPLPFSVGPYTSDMSFSPDGKSLAFARAFESDRIELWIGDLATGGETRFATEPIINEGVDWSPDSRTIAYLHSQGGPQTIVIKPVGGNQPGRRVLEQDASFKAIDGWTPDGRRLVFDRQDPATRWDLWILDVEAGTAKPLLAGPFNEQTASISLDGRWMAYTSDETGRSEVYVQPFETAGPRIQITTTGAHRVFWHPDGKHLGFQFDSEPLAVRMADILPGPDFRVGPSSIFMRAPPAIETADMTRDGRLAVQLPAGKRQPEAITVVTDWTSLLRRR
jgi:Tol biopolymer transport system component